MTHSTNQATGVQRQNNGGRFQRTQNAGLPNNGGQFPGLPNNGGQFPRAQNTTNPSISTFTAIQQYTDLVEGANPFSGLQAEIQPQSTRSPIALLLGLSFT